MTWAIAGFLRDISRLPCRLLRVARRFRRGNKPGIDAQFSIDEEQLAFPDLELLDEFVYPRPLPTVVEALRKWPTRTELWLNLPTPQEI